MIALLLKNWRVLVMVALCVVIGLLYIDVQHQKAEVAKARLEKSELEKGYAQAVQNATTEAMQKLQAETSRGDTLAAQLTTTRRDLATARADITRRIPDAAHSAGPDCAFGPAFVRVWNDAFGAAAPGVPEVPGSPGPGGEAGPPPAPGAGVREGEPVTPEDLLANVRDNGALCQQRGAQVLKLIELLEGRP